MTTKFSIKYGMTINVGDYSNVRPELSFEDEIPNGYDPIDYIQTWTRKIIKDVHRIADDELERHGRKAIYSGEQLYRVRSNAPRKCIVLYPVGAKLPEESNWKERDSWQEYHNIHIAADFPDDMRHATAAHYTMAVKDIYPDFEVYSFMNGEFDNLPPLPDPGPEPVWHQKGLESYLGRRYLDIPEDQWETVAVLDYVDKNYLSRVYELTRPSWNTPAKLDKADALAFILENRPFPVEVQQEPEPDEEDDMDDEGWDDDEY